MPLRTSPIGPGAAWTPPTYTVDDNLKVVGGGHRPTGPNNWGRWGDDDQNGTLNYIGPEQVLHASSLVKTGERFSLGLPIEGAAPRHPVRSAAKHYVTQSGSDAVIDTPQWTTNFVWTDDNIDMATHGSTHFDALAHVNIDHTMYNGYWAGAVSSTGAEVLGIGHQAKGFVGRGVLIDVARHLGVEYVEPTMQFEPDFLDEVLAAQGVELRSGDIVLFRTGAVGRWWGLENDEQRLEWFAASPGPGLSSLAWFHEHEIAAGGSDTYAFEAIPGEVGPSQTFPLHRPLIVDLGFSIGEFWDLDELAAACAADRRYEFLLIAQPLILPRGLGSPLNPIAIK
jgi:kynurenine formamidase